MSEVNPILAYADSYRLMARDAKNQGRLETVSMWSVVADLERNIAPILDRLTAERDAALGREAALREELETSRSAFKEELEGVKYTRRRFRQERDKLQQRLTAADERADHNARVSAIAVEDVLLLQKRADVLEGFRAEVQAICESGNHRIKHTQLQMCGFLDDLRGKAVALKPAEGGGDEA